MSSSDEAAAEASLRPERTGCPFCREPIHPAASKCPHCGELVAGRRPPPTFQGVLKRVVAALGVATAVLSLIFGIREAYFFVRESEATRAHVAAQRAAAQQLKALDKLDYAVIALDRALELRPDDPDLRRERFLLKAMATVGELEVRGGLVSATVEEREEITSLVLEGFQVLHGPLSDPERAAVLVMLGRALRMDGNWTDAGQITAVFEEARGLAPREPEAAFWLGIRLLEDGDTEATALSLLEEATRLRPESAFYQYGLAAGLRDVGRLGEGLRAMLRAVELEPRQQELRGARAVGSARSSLGPLLRRAHEAQDITGASFLGLSFAERRALLEKALAFTPADRHLQYLAARYFHATGDDEAARRAARAALAGSPEDLDGLRQAARYTYEALVLYESILKRLDSDPELLANVSRALREHADAERYDTALDMGYEDRHRYKIGLKAVKGPSEDGVHVVEAYPGYPFAKAGIRPGDRIVRLAHREVRQLRDIWALILEFQPGTSLPVAVRRDGEEQVITLVVE